MQSNSAVDIDNTSVISDALRWRILVVILAAISMSLISVSIVNVALPAIQQGLDATDSSLQWVLSGYALTFGVVLVAAGRAGDILGRGGLFLFGVLIFTLASIASGLAPNSTALNIARFIQGVGSGFLNPQGLGMIQQYFRGAERAKAFGYFGSMVGVSVGIGPVLGGLLIKAAGPDIGWRLTFLVNVPFGIFTLIMGYLWFPKPLIRLGGDMTKSRLYRLKTLFTSLDPIGSLLLGLAVFTILFPFMEARSQVLTWLLLPLGLLLVVAWVQWEKYFKAKGCTPMVDLNIFKTRSFTNGTTIMSLYFMGMTSIWVLVTLYMQLGIGKSAFEASLIGVPSAFISAIAAYIAGRLVINYGRRVVIGGLMLGVFGIILSMSVVWFNYNTGLSIWWLLASLAFVGMAQGSVVSPNQALTLAEVPLQYAGSSGAIMQTGQRMGTSVGIAMITAAVFTLLSSTNWGIAVTAGFILIAIIMILALVIAIKDWRDRGELSQYQKKSSQQH
ncbi:MAG TPA: MFS transporter [Alcanivoracaceae bacterium]|nr:MFS transporter [Alcanivoracaceae bacterium]